MAQVGDPLGRMRLLLEKRLRRFTIYHAILVVVAVVLIAWITLPSGSETLWWAFVYVAIVMPAGIPLIWWINRRGFNRAMGALEVLRPRISDAKTSMAAGYLLILDSGLVLSLDPRSNALRFIAFFSAGGALIRPDLAHAEKWALRIRGMRTEGGVTNKKGPEPARAELERLRAAFGANMSMLYLREVRPERMAAGEPMWHEVLTFLMPRWWEHTQAVAAGLDALPSFLEGARIQYFSKAGSAA